MFYLKMLSCHHGVGGAKTNSVAGYGELYMAAVTGVSFTKIKSNGEILFLIVTDLIQTIESRHVPVIRDELLCRVSLWQHERK